MFSLFSCLLACLLDLLLSRVADEAFYKQPFADLIGYVYVAKLIPFLVLILPTFCLELMFFLSQVALLLKIFHIGTGSCLRIDKAGYDPLLKILQN
jgi:hypothetical protein